MVSGTGSLGVAGVSGDPLPLIEGMKHQGEVENEVAVERLFRARVCGLVRGL